MHHLKTGIEYHTVTPTAGASCYECGDPATVTYVGPRDRDTGAANELDLCDRHAEAFSKGE